jgi:hypothetical protein
MDRYEQLLDSERVRFHEIFDNFDFKKVHRCMTLMDWRWATTNGVPTIEDIRNCASMLLLDVIMGIRFSDEYNVGTGGFHVTYDKKYDIISLSFVITDWDDSYIEESVAYKRCKKIEELLEIKPTI